MSWRDFFVSRHTLWLEGQVRELKQQVLDLQKVHAEELSRVITHNERLQDELARTRIVLTPDLQRVHLPHEHEDETPPPAPKTPVGTPWQRVQAREIEEEDKRWAAKQAAKGVTHGVPGEGRLDAPLSGPSKPS
jgi:hypothetical protein